MTEMLTEVAIASLNHFTYCPHRCWRMFCAGEFVENAYTVEGSTLHDRVHTLGEGFREDTWQVRSIWLKSQKYGLVGKADLVESKAGEIYPVEYKRGRKNPWENDALQVCGQALCLEELTGRSIPTGYVYSLQSHQRQDIVLDDKLRRETIATIESVRQMLQTGEMPPALYYTTSCRGCSLYGGCLPQAASKVERYQEIG
ncbi:CRISPR-associated protein Cas4 [Oxynema aestuarii]|uniref:CRISPR-associated exonuclease Cas4 n=1 Tax=Oxynema aestuarii AP17 TaxID=2064643 RepID=A0A6H1TTJ4_9CYAN|nr:CRISPR-associated protein Cas4 [Oxynema aestuarii]QIZ69924.1 CRISPR-associated protein Cas4 [Oxynema aestuarii AP17]